MRLGTQTGSLTNHILSRMVIGQPEPQVGMGATILGWTDRYAATIVAVHNWASGCLIEVREDKEIRTDRNGESESQTYRYEPNPNGCKRTYRRAANGQWQQVTFNDRTKRWNKTNGQGLRIGERSAYRDFSF